MDDNVTRYRAERVRLAHIMCQYFTANLPVVATSVDEIIGIIEDNMMPNPNDPDGPTIKPSPLVLPIPGQYIQPQDLAPLHRVKVNEERLAAASAGGGPVTGTMVMRMQSGVLLGIHSLSPTLFGYVMDKCIRYDLSIALAMLKHHYLGGLGSGADIMKIDEEVMAMYTAGCSGRESEEAGEEVGEVVGEVVGEADDADVKPEAAGGQTGKAKRNKKKKMKKKSKDKSKDRGKQPALSTPDTLPVAESQTDTTAVPSVNMHIAKVDGTHTLAATTPCTQCSAVTDISAQTAICWAPHPDPTLTDHGEFRIYPWPANIRTSHRRLACLLADYVRRHWAGHGTKTTVGEIVHWLQMAGCIHWDPHDPMCFLKNDTVHAVRMLRDRKGYPLDYDAMEAMVQAVLRAYNGSGRHEGWYAVTTGLSTAAADDAADKGRGTKTAGAAARNPYTFLGDGALSGHFMYL